MRFYIFFKLQDQTGKVVHQDYMATNTNQEVRPMQLFQKIRELGYQIAPTGLQDYKDWPLTVNAHISSNKETGEPIPNGPNLTLACR